MNVAKKKAKEHIPLTSIKANSRARTRVMKVMFPALRTQVTFKN
jgi:hypothetical protein